MNDTYKVYTDGGSRGNPGPAAGGLLIFDEKDKLLELDAKYFGEITNNQAEYKALILAAKALQARPVEHVTFYLDSELIVKQLTGVYKTKNSGIIPLKEKVEDLIKPFESVEFIHVRRELNTFADKLVNIVLDSIE